MHALQITTGKEFEFKATADITESLTIYVPAETQIFRKGKSYIEVVKVLFPGYAFIEDMTDKIYYQLKKIPGFIKVLNAPLTAEEQQDLSWMINGGTPMPVYHLTIDSHKTIIKSDIPDTFRILRVIPRQQRVVCKVNIPNNNIIVLSAIIDRVNL